MKQAYQIIPIDDYAVGVSDTQPKDGDIRVHITTGNYSTHHSTDNNLHKGWKKLMFTIDKDMRAESIPMLLLPNREEDVEKLAKQQYPQECQAAPSDCGCNWCAEMRANISGFIRGYKAEQQDKKWSDADMKQCWYAHRISDDLKGKKHKWDNFEDYLQSLQKKKYPETIELETVLTGQCNCACHKPGFDLMHMMPCCHPTRALIINNDLTITC